eukprot:8171256-Alexandrium_andersonii.AAC.1
MAPTPRDQEIPASNGSRGHGSSCARPQPKQLRTAKRPAGRAERSAVRSACCLAHWAPPGWTRTG